MSKIKNIQAREILASGGNPSLEVTVDLESGFSGEASVSYGASAGSHEAFVLTDNNPARYHGQGMLTAVNNINGEIRHTLLGQEASYNQIEIDRILIDLDGTKNKSRLGGNAILGVSLALARAASNEQKLPLYRYLRQLYQIPLTTWQLPLPMVVMIEGGKHADNSTDLQEYLVSLLGHRSAAENVRIAMEIYAALKTILKNNGLSVNVGNEGAFAPNNLPSNEKPLELLLQAIVAAGYNPGVDVGLSLDAAASEFFDNGSYQFKIDNQSFTGDQLIDYYLPWFKEYPIVTIEDMLHEDDWDNWVKLTQKCGDVINIADDLTVTNLQRWQKAIDLGAANGILVKLNQAGTLSETVDCCLLANQHQFPTIPSHRGGGETNDTFMVDLAVAVGSRWIKVGPTRGERVAKYNRLMRIDEELKLA